MQMRTPQIREPFLQRVALELLLHGTYRAHEVFVHRKSRLRQPNGRRKDARNRQRAPLGQCRTASRDQSRHADSQVTHSARSNRTTFRRSDEHVGCGRRRSGLAEILNDHTPVGEAGDHKPAAAWTGAVGTCHTERERNCDGCVDCVATGS